MSVDWFAVDCVLRGTPLPLTPEEQRAVVRRARLRKATDPKFVGAVTCEELGRRMRVCGRTVERIKDELPQADKLKCDVCGSVMWVVHDGDIIEGHADDFFKECPMSGQVFEADWESELANQAVWLARRLRDGDPHGVWEYLERMQPSSMRPLLVAALAGFGDSEDPFAWLKEAV